MNAELMRCMHPIELRAEMRTSFESARFVGADGETSRRVTARSARALADGLDDAVVFCEWRRANPEAA